jgi:DNA-directed RNA polymerase specialized sigma24 family protein
VKTRNRTVEELTAACSEETTRFYRTSQSNSPSCYELFRRALDDHDQKAFAAIFRIYERQVLSWITRHPVFWLTNCAREDYASVAFSRFYFALDGNIASDFPSVDKILSYLKSCVHTAIYQEYRKQKTKIEEHPIDEYQLSAPPPDSAPEFDDLWAHLCALIPDGVDQVLMRCAFVEQLKPHVIAAEYPEHWESARDVSVALYRIRRILRADPVLRKWVGLR